MTEQSETNKSIENKDVIKINSVMSMKEALELEEKIYTRLQERRKAARLAEATRWDFLNCD